MKKIYVMMLLLVSIFMLCGCDQVMEQVENIAQQVDVEEIVTDVIENIDWNQLEQDAKDGYDALTEQFPALKSENIRQFLKDNGLDLMNKYIKTTDESKQETAKKLGEIIKILDPELTDEVNAVIDK